MLQRNIIILLGLPIFLTGCATNMYRPGTPNIPLVDTAGKGHVEFALSNNGADFKLNARIHGPFNFAFGLNTHSGQSSMEGAFGYHRRSAKIAYGVQVGYGYGNTEFDESSGGLNSVMYGSGKYHAVFIQPMFAGGDDANLFGILFKISYLPYAVTYMNHLYVSSPDQLDKYYSGSAFESGIFYRHFYQRGMTLTLYMGMNNIKSTMPWNISQLDAGFVAGIGLGYRF